MKIYKIILLIIILFPLSASAITVCECGAKKSVEEERIRAFGIFTGTVKNVEPQMDGKTFKTDFVVHKSWKGVTHPSVSVFTEGNSPESFTLSGISCGYGFVEGQTYLVYSYRGHNNNGLSYVSSCGGTKLIGEAGADLQALGEAVYSFDEKQ